MVRKPQPRSAGAGADPEIDRLAVDPERPNAESLKRSR
jgi:hypothetical protein